MAWIGLHVKCPEVLNEIILAELSQLPFSTFEETDEGIVAYVRNISGMQLMCRKY